MRWSIAGKSSCRPPSRSKIPLWGRSFIPFQRHIDLSGNVTRHIDLSAKLADYFRLPSIAHYLIVDPEKPRIIHHARAIDDAILTRIVNDGTIRLDPPGLELAMPDIYPGPPSSLGEP
jgi:hypothetical protein